MSSNALQEVFDFVHHGRLLWGSKPPAWLDVEQVHRLPRHRGLGLRNMVDPQQADPKTVEQSFDFDTVSSYYLGRVWNAVPGSLERQITSEFDVADFLIGARLPEDYYPFAGAIAADLHGAALNRASGKNVSFLETLFDIYRTGGLPVGWTGTFGQGIALNNVKLLACYPGIESFYNNETYEQWLERDRRSWQG